MTAEACLLEHPPANEKDQCQNIDWNRNPEEIALPKGFDGLRKTVDRDALRHDERESSGDGLHGECRDQRGNLKMRDHNAADKPADDSNQNADHHRREDPKAEVIDELCGDNAGKRNNRADGNVNTAGQQNHSHADRADSGHGDLPTDVQQILCRQERLCQNREKDEYEQEHQIDKHLADGKLRFFFHSETPLFTCRKPSQGCVPG